MSLHAKIAKCLIKSIYYQHCCDMRQTHARLFYPSCVRVPHSLQHNTHCIHRICSIDIVNIAIDIVNIAILYTVYIHTCRILNGTQ